VKPPVKVLVRSKSDADAVKHALKRFLEGELEIDTLKGAREPSAIKDQLKRHIDFKGLIIVMLGLEDKDALKLDGEYPSNFVFHLIPKSKVRNERPHQILRHYLKAKAEFRMRIKWSSQYSAYTLLKAGEDLEDWITNPRFDVYMPSMEMALKLEELCKVRPTLIVKKLGGLHSLYQGARLIADIAFAERGSDIKVERKNSREDIDIASIEEHAELNRAVIEKLEEASLSYLSSFDVDYAVVPWSGGKDSTAALILSLKVFKDKVIPTFIDTGLEFKETLEYVNQLASRLGITPLKLKAPIREIIEAGKPLPTNKNRWCTQLKVKAAKDFIKQLSKKGRVLMVVGDREAESPSRLRRPATITHEDHIEAAPIKQWSALHVQLYLALNKVPVNAMYDYGFFRIGCYICPALRNWEIKLIMEKEELKYIRENALFEIFAKERGMLIKQP